MTKVNVILEERSDEESNVCLGSFADAQDDRKEGAGWQERRRHRTQRHEKP